MLIPPRYALTSSITSFVSSIEASREIIDSYDLPIEVENNIRRHSILRSSVFSARIEGVDVHPADIDTNPSKLQKKEEIHNILLGTEWIREKGKKDTTLKDILTMHSIIMKGLTDYPGHIRREVSAIFNSAGIAIYMPPPPGQIIALMNRLATYIKSNKESLIPIKAVLTHYVFEKIHPFLDGNGRVGRILLQKVLIQEGYGMKGLLPIEEYLDTHRSTYYRMLELPERDVTGYVEFMLTAISETAKKTKELILTKKDIDPTDYLLPRRAELLRIIRDHHMVSFDQVHRRFMAVNPRTLRYDLKQLADSGFIKKRGTTKGVYYEAN